MSQHNLMNKLYTRWSIKELCFSIGFLSNVLLLMMKNQALLAGFNPI